MNKYNCSETWNISYKDSGLDSGHTACNQDSPGYITVNVFTIKLKLVRSYYAMVLLVWPT